MTIVARLARHPAWTGREGVDSLKQDVYVEAGHLWVKCEVVNPPSMAAKVSESPGVLSGEPIVERAARTVYLALDPADVTDLLLLLRQAAISARSTTMEEAR